MPLYTFTDAKTYLKKRVGNRSDITDSEYGKYVNQAQQVMATNLPQLEVFDQLMYPPLPLTVGQYIYSINNTGGLGLVLTLDKFWAFNQISLNIPYVQKLRRGESEKLLWMRNIPPGYPTQWVRNGGRLSFFSIPHIAMSIGGTYRRTPTIDTLEVPDEWFEHLLNLAMVFIYPTIGRNKERDDLLKKLPTQLQLGVLNPLSPNQWEALADPDVGFYAH